MEAKLLACHRSAADGDSPPPRHLLVEVAVIQTYARDDLLIDGTNHIDPSRWNPLFYVFRHYFGHAVDLGRNYRNET